MKAVSVKRIVFTALIYKPNIIINYASIWSCGGMTVNTVPSPVAGDGMVFVTSGFRDSVMQAIRLDKAVGDITDSDAIAWSYDRDTPYVPSPLLYDGKLLLTCLDAVVVDDVLYLRGYRYLYCIALD